MDNVEPNGNLSAAAVSRDAMHRVSTIRMQVPT